jgi:MFS family permease
VFYGWWIVAAGSCLQVLQSALMGQAYGAYVVLLREEFGWSKTLLSGASSLREAESGVMGPFQGMLLDRFGPRRVVLAGAVTLGVGFLLFSRIDSPATFFGAFFVMSVGASLMGYMTVTFAVVHWFERRRATAISLTTGGFAFGGMVVPLTVLALEQFGWRTTAVISGLIIMAAGIPLSRVFHHHPHEMGLAPDGDPPPEGTGAAGPRATISPTDFTLGEALRTPSFWWLSLGHASALFVVSAMGVHLLAHLNQSRGYSLGEGAGVVFLMTLVFLMGTVSGGLLGDRVDKRRLVVVCMGMHAAGLLMLSHAVNLAMVLAFAVLHGTAWGWRGPQMSALRADYFGRAAFGKILGVSNVVIIFGSISGPLIAGIMYDQTGNYRIGFDILAVIAALGSIFFVLARRPTPPARGAREIGPPL